ncbi:MAG: hypothetical protein ACI4OI_04375, partial [Gemmiger sp.]
MCAPSVRAAELPSDISSILAGSGLSSFDVGEWTLETVLDQLGETLTKGLREPIHLAARSVFYLLAVCVMGILADGTS